MVEVLEEVRQNRKASGCVNIFDPDHLLVTTKYGRAYSLYIKTSGEFRATLAP